MRIEEMNKRATRLIRCIFRLLVFAFAFGAVYLTVDTIKGFIEYRSTISLTINVLCVFVCVLLAKLDYIIADNCTRHIRVINRHNEYLEKQYAKGKISKQEMEENKR